MKRKFTVNNGVFVGETYSKYNGITVTEEQGKDGEPIVGRSGNTRAFVTNGGGRLFLSEDQVSLV